jgi:hypothetical protein
MTATRFREVFSLAHAGRAVNHLKTPT